jgi:hypothetical protein
MSPSVMMGGFSAGLGFIVCLRGFRLELPSVICMGALGSVVWVVPVVLGGCGLLLVPADGAGDQSFDGVVVGLMFPFGGFGFRSEAQRCA